MNGFCALKSYYGRPFPNPVVDKILGRKKNQSAGDYFPFPDFKITLFGLNSCNELVPIKAIIDFTNNDDSIINANTANKFSSRYKAIYFGREHQNIIQRYDIPLFLPMKPRLKLSLKCKAVFTNVDSGEKDPIFGGRTIHLSRKDLSDRLNLVLLPNGCFCLLPKKVTSLFHENLTILPNKYLCLLPRFNCKIDRRNAARIDNESFISNIDIFKIRYESNGILFEVNNFSTNGILSTISNTKLKEIKTNTNPRNKKRINFDIVNESEKLRYSLVGKINTIRKKKQTVMSFEIERDKKDYWNYYAEVNRQKIKLIENIFKGRTRYEAQCVYGQTENNCKMAPGVSIGYMSDNN